MKYLKTYEKYTSIDNFKKYIIWQAKRTLMILQAIEVTEYHLKFKKLYALYNTGEIKRTNEKLNIFHDFDKIKRHIIYESDDLSDCLERLEILSNSKKYNI